MSLEEVLLLSGQTGKVGCLLPQMKQGKESAEGWSLEVTSGHSLLEAIDFTIIGGVIALFYVTIILHNLSNILKCLFTSSHFLATQ